jgi:hypothetical protein
VVEPLAGPEGRRGAGQPQRDASRLADQAIFESVLKEKRQRERDGQHRDAADPVQSEVQLPALDGPGRRDRTTLGKLPHTGLQLALELGDPPLQRFEARLFLRGHGRCCSSSSSSVESWGATSVRPPKRRAL